jgi:hypothetical protein
VGLAKEEGRKVYLMAIWSIYINDHFGHFWQFGTFCIHLVHFSAFGITHQEKSGNPDITFDRKP